MDWDEFLAATKLLGLDGSAPPLMMAGIAGANATRYIMETRLDQHALPNDRRIFESFAALSFVSPDFVWNGRVVRVGGGGGHPALARTDNVLCAGRIEDGWFWFHSGHYHPKRENALHFMADFIRNSCATLVGPASDAMVAKLSGIVLRIYRENSDKLMDDTTFGKLAGGGGAPPDASPTHDGRALDDGQCAAFHRGEPTDIDRTFSAALDRGVGRATEAHAEPGAGQRDDIAERGYLEARHQSLRPAAASGPDRPRSLPFGSTTARGRAAKSATRRSACPVGSITVGAAATSCATTARRGGSR